MSPTCEAPGCTHPASWQRGSTLVVNIEEFLCDEHFSELSEERPRTAAFYGPLINEADDATGSLQG